MTTVTIYIKTSGPTPNPAPVKPGYEVVFQMDGWEAEVEVDFGDKSPFVSQTKKFSLNGAIQAQSQKSYTIEDTEGSFGFNIIPPPPGRRNDPEPPNPTGDLEVTRDPPKDEDEQK